VRRASALAVALALLALPAVADAQVVTLRPSPGPELTQGPQLTGPRVAWSQTLCLRGCDIDVPSETDAVYEVRSAGGGEPARRLFRARTSGSFSGPNFGYDRYSFLSSVEALATVHLTLGGDELEGESGRVALRAGAPGTRRALLVNCSGPFVTGPAPVALDGSRLAYDPDPCDDLPRLVVRDLVTGEAIALPEPAGGALLNLHGRYVAWIAGEAAAARLTVHDLVTGAAAYSAPAVDVLALDLDADGTVAAVSGQPSRPCSTGRLLRYSVAAPAAADLGPACAGGVRIEAGRIVFLAWERFTRTLRAVGSDGAVQDLVRFGRVLPGGFDFDGERLAWVARDCGGGEAIFLAARADAPLNAGSINCRARFRSGVVPVRRGVATVRLTCPRGCGGELSLRHMGRRDFSLPRGEREVGLRLRPDARARLERRGSLTALAKIVTRNRAGDRQARSRAVTLVAR
jgi:hypothetical protein